MSLDTFVLKETWNDGYNTRLGELIPLLRNYREMLNSRIEIISRSSAGIPSEREQLFSFYKEELRKLEEVLDD